MVGAWVFISFMRMMMSEAFLGMAFAVPYPLSMQIIAKMQIPLFPASG